MAMIIVTSGYYGVVRILFYQIVSLAYLLSILSHRWWIQSIKYNVYG